MQKEKIKHVLLKIKSINFTDIVDKVEYKNNPKIEGMSFKAEI